MFLNSFAILKGLWDNKEKKEKTIRFLTFNIQNDHTLLMTTNQNITHF